MNVLIVCSGNYNVISPFVLDQNAALSKLGVTFSYFMIKGKGPFGYLKNIFKLRRMIGATQPDLIHAHYGLSGLLAVMQRLSPVVITFHGTDINSRILRFLSGLAMLGARQSIFVSESLKMKMKMQLATSAIIPCGIDLDVFKPMDKAEARQKFGLHPHKKYILFASAFDNPVKNYPLAKAAVDMLNDGDVELLELKGCSRKEVSLLLNAADVALLTSFSEGSPQFIKEALGCNRPVVATDVGDIKDYLPAEGCYMTSYDPADVAEKLRLAINYKEPVKGRDEVRRFDNNLIAAAVYDIYSKIVA